MLRYSVYVESRNHEIFSEFSKFRNSVIYTDNVKSLNMS